MQELAIWMLQWTFTAIGLAHLLGALFLAWAAARLSPQRSVAKFLLVALLVCVAAIVLGVLEHDGPRHILAWSLWVFSIVLVYAAALGVMVAKSKGPRFIFSTVAVLFAFQAPLSWLSAIYFACYIGHDCP